MRQDLTKKDQALEAAIEAWRRTPVPEGPPAQVVCRVTAFGPAIVDDRGAACGSIRTRRRPLASRLLRSAAALVLLLLLWQTAERLGFLRAAPAFADVVARLRQTHTVFFKTTATLEGQKPIVTKCTLAEPGFLRMHRTDAGNITIIFDESRAAGLLLLADQKKAIALSAAGDLPKETASLIAWYRSLRDAQQDAVDDLGPRQIGGKATFGFRVKKGRQHFNVWVDRKTSLPVQAETDMADADVKGRIVITDFVFDAEVPPGLFTLTPPKGYTVAEKVKLAMPTEEDVTELVRTLAHLNGDVFPDDLKQKTLQAILARDTTPMAGAIEKDFVRGMKLTNGLLFVHLRKTEGDWRYRGHGVKLGDGGRIVCAWKRRNETSWRAAFGDLRVRPLTAEQAADLGNRGQKNK